MCSKNSYFKKTYNNDLLKNGTRNHKIYNIMFWFKNLIQLIRFLSDIQSLKRKLKDYQKTMGESCSHDSNNNQRKQNGTGDEIQK